MIIWSILVVLVLWTVPAWTASIQYQLSTGNITAAQDDPITPVTGYGVVTIPEPVSAIVWPLPTVTCSPQGTCPTSCPTGTGQAVWTRVSDPGAVTATGGGLAIQIDRVGFFFATGASTILPGCYQVFSFAELKAIAVGAVQAIVSANDLVTALNEVNVVVARRCPGTTGGANCDTARANMVTMDTRYPTSGAIATFTTNLVTLDTDIVGFKTAQGW